jgi:quercetin dioxygenase-like cupin family protein/DNA-binding XRE family transcriptional regulator
LGLGEREILLKQKILLTVRQLMDKFPSVATIHEHAAEVTQTLGSRIHSMRESRGWTLEQLAQRAELSKAYLSRLESGDRQASIAALCAVAKAYGVSVAHLFEQPDAVADCVIVRGDIHGSGRGDVRSGGASDVGRSAMISANGLRYVPLSSSTKPFNLQPIAVTIPRDRPGSESYQHDGEEWLHVTAGRVRLTLNGAVHELETGDSVHFDSRLAHRLDAMGGSDAKIILVACLIPVALNPRRATAEPAANLVG